MKIGFVICWLGKLPDYFPIWLKSCEFNMDYDFLLVCDTVPGKLPDNVHYISFSKKKIISRIEERICKNPSIKAAYRLCDFRPMYGIIFKEELEKYNYWGYCDIDLVFGKINNFLSFKELTNYDAVFNGGHFTLIKNTEEMNNLYKEKGAIFNYKIVSKLDAIFAFDETTGIQRIARKNGINAKFGIEYIETESKYNQLRSRMDINNPNIQGFFWEKGELIRVKCENERLFYQKKAYIHLQKRKLFLLDKKVIDSKSFWITPKGFISKTKEGYPALADIKEYNHFDGLVIMRKEEADYKKEKIRNICSRNIFQIFVRIVQQKAGINAKDGTREESMWERY